MLLLTSLVSRLHFLAGARNVVWKRDSIEACSMAICCPLHESAQPALFSGLTPSFPSLESEAGTSRWGDILSWQGTFGPRTMCPGGQLVLGPHVQGDSWSGGTHGPPTPAHGHLRIRSQTWAYPMSTVLATVAFLLLLDTSLLSQAGIMHYSQQLTLQHCTKLLFVLFIVALFFFKLIFKVSTTT